MKRSLAILGLALLLCTPGLAHAGEPPMGAPRGKVKWRNEWPHFRTWEAAVTVVATVGVFIAEDQVPDPPHARVTLEVPLLDPGVRSLLRGRTEQTQRVAGRMSDVGFRALAFAPYVIDVGFASLAVHRNPEVAAQLFLIDIQALTLSGATQLLVSRAVGRQRPYVKDCVDGEALGRPCGTRNDFRGFFSGHTAGAFTTAGLMCLHHQHLPLFGGGPIEAWACAWALTAATATGVARIVHDVHFASDVIVGAGIGWFYGYMMPRFLHFKAGKLVPGKHSGLAWAPSFAATGDGGILSVGGAW